MLSWPLLIVAQASGAVAQPVMPAFLAGCWEQRRNDRWTEECWTDARGELMIGSGRDGTGSSISTWEWMRIERRPDGRVTFYGSPKGATPVSFNATESTASSATFVNESHDYPQRIHYALTVSGLDAEVSLADGSNATRWHYRRTAGAEVK